ncbi:carboxymuconolactone decarboxylase family protein [Streptomyces sp. NPDC001985]|uniref:carboxymuconolactone decarboxylase family protein n=1 Tax=Streptomyces sp. NPDC001985 TaxID=3154406 RepID=UPI00331F628D
MEPRMDLFAHDIGARIGKGIFGIHRTIEEAGLSGVTRELVLLRVSQINGCGHCLDMHAEAAAAGETPVRLALVAAWRHATVFTEAERAALALAEEGTRIADASPGVSDGTWAGVREHYDDDQIVALVALIAMINATNRIAVTLNSAGGSHRPGQLAELVG